MKKLVMKSLVSVFFVACGAQNSASVELDAQPEKPAAVNCIDAPGAGIKFVKNQYNYVVNVNDTSKSDLVVILDIQSNKFLFKTDMMVMTSDNIVIFNFDFSDALQNNQRTAVETALANLVKIPGTTLSCNYLNGAVGNSVSGSN